MSIYRWYKIRWTQDNQSDTIKANTIRKPKVTSVEHILKYQRGMEEYNVMISKEMKLINDILRAGFSELYSKITIKDRVCYILNDGRVISLGCLNSYGAFVVEYANNVDEAKLNRFEDGDLFYVNDMGVAEMFSAMQREIGLWG